MSAESLRRTLRVMLPGGLGDAGQAGDCVKQFQYVRVFEHWRVRQAARRVGGRGSNPEPHAVFFHTSLNFVVKMLLQPPEMKFNKEKKR
jgi:hypothetical protein